jgi:mycothiol synthase
METISLAGVQIRTPRADELAAIVEMLNVCDVHDCGVPDTSFDQEQAEWNDGQFQLASDAWVAVTPDECIVGYATVGRHRFTRMRFYGRVHPAYRGQGIGSQLLSLVEKRAQEFAALAEPDERIFFQTGCHGSEHQGKRLLESRGYTCVRHTWGMAIEMSEAPVEPTWPEGIRLRPFVPERDTRAVFEAKEEAFHDHWGYLPGDFQQWSQSHVISYEHFDPSLWFIAMDGEQVAGIALCTYYLEDGEVDILGVRRPWRQLGLGMALLKHAFGEFYRRGTRKVGLGVDSENLTGATRLYERAGMSIALVYDIYEKDWRAGIDTSTHLLVE